MTTIMYPPFSLSPFKEGVSSEPHPKQYLQYEIIDKLEKRRESTQIVQKKEEKPVETEFK